MVQMLLITKRILLCYTGYYNLGYRRRYTGSINSTYHTFLPLRVHYITLSCISVCIANKPGTWPSLLQVLLHYTLCIISTLLSIRSVLFKEPCPMNYKYWRNRLCHRHTRQRPAPLNGTHHLPCYAAPIGNVLLRQPPILTSLCQPIHSYPLSISFALIVANRNSISGCGLGFQRVSANSSHILCR